MKQALLWLGLAAGLTAGAAEAPKAELFGGYGLMKVDDESLHGWAAGAAFRLKGRLALAFDASGHSRTADGVDADRLVLAAGPSLSLLRSERLAVEAHVLAGAVRDSQGLEVFGVSITENDTGFGLLAGGSLDLSLSRRFGLRLARVDWVYASREGQSSSDVRFAAGLLFRP